MFNVWCAKGLFPILPKKADNYIVTVINGKIIGNLAEGRVVTIKPSDKLPFVVWEHQNYLTEMIKQPSDVETSEEVKISANDLSNLMDRYVVPILPSISSLKTKLKR